MKVAVITNVGEERCGNAEYGRYLCAELEKYMEVEAMSRFPQEGFDVVLINWCPAVVHFTMDDLHYAKATGMKTILLVQQSFGTPYMIGLDDTLCVVDAVTAHERMDIRADQTVNFRIIPHGIVEVDALPEYAPNETIRLGTAGFGFKSKNMEVTARAAKELGGQALVIAPQHPWCEGGNAEPLWSELRGWSAELVTDWLPVQEVVRKLATCDVNVYTATEPNSGQSGSARMLVAAKRPTILLRSAKVRQLEEYGDELYFADSMNEVKVRAGEIFAAIKRGDRVMKPDRVIRECGWTRTGQMYRDLIEELCADRVNQLVG